MRKRRRLAAFAAAIMGTLTIPAAFLQEYFKYNPYLIPGLLLISILIYLALFVTNDNIIKLTRLFYAKSQKVCIVTLLVAAVVVAAVLSVGVRFAINKSKEHISALKIKDMPLKEKISPQITALKLVQPNQPTTEAAKQYFPPVAQSTAKKQKTRGGTPVLKELPPSPNPLIAKKQEDIPEVETVLPLKDVGRGFTVKASSNPVRICKNHFSEDFPKGGPSLKIYVSNVKNISGKRLVSGIISTVDGNGERDKEAFTLKPIGACMVHDIYSIRITDISDDYECAGFATSFDDKPCK